MAVPARELHAGLDLGLARAHWPGSINPWRRQPPRVYPARLCQWQMQSGHKGCQVPTPTSKPSRVNEQAEQGVEQHDKHGWKKEVGSRRVQETGDKWRLGCGKACL